MDEYLKMAPLDEEGVGLDTARVRGFAFTDDKVVVAESIEDLQNMLRKLNTSLKNVGLKINVNKIKIIVFEGNVEKIMCNNVLNDERIEEVGKYIHLGSVLTSDAKKEGELDRRINEGKMVIGRAGAII